MPERNPHILYLNDVAPDDVGDAEGFRGVDIRWMFTDATVEHPHSTLFRVVFPKGAFHKPHYHTKTDELLWTVRGRAIQWVNGVECEMTAGSAMYIPRNVIHWMRNDGDEDVEVIGFSPDVKNYAESDQILMPDPGKYDFSPTPRKITP